MDFKKDPYLETLCDHCCSDRYKDYRYKCHRAYQSIIKKGKKSFRKSTCEVSAERRRLGMDVQQMLL